MYKKSYSNLVHLMLLFATLLSSVYFASATSSKDDYSDECTDSKEISNENSNETTVKPNNHKSFQIRSRFGMQCALDISRNDDGAILTLQDPKNTVSQQWYIDCDGRTIRSKLNDLCLISNGPYPSMVTLGSCGRPGNQFVQNVHNQIEMFKDDVCLDVSAGNDTLGGYVMTKKCNCANSKRLNQKWNFESTKNKHQTKKKNAFRRRTLLINPLFIIRTKLSSKKVLDASKKNSYPTGTGVVMNDYNENAITQKWYIGAGSKTIQSALNDYCLISNGNYPELVTVEPCDSRRDNKWVFNSATQQIEIATISSICLDVSNSNENDGANVSQWSCHVHLNQKWTLGNIDSLV